MFKSGYSQGTRAPDFRVRVTALAGILLAALVVSAWPPGASAQTPSLQFSSSVPDLTCRLAQGELEKTCTFTLPEATGGTGTVTYSVLRLDPPPSVYRPRRIRIDSSTRELSVKAATYFQTMNGWTVRYRAEDSDGNVATDDFVVKFDGYPYVPRLTKLEFEVGKANDHTIFVQANGEVTASLDTSGSSGCFNAPPPHGSLTPDFQGLPGMTLSVNNERDPSFPFSPTVHISGTPTRPGECDGFKLVVTDGDGDSVTTDTFKVYFNAAPSFASNWNLDAGPGSASNWVLNTALSVGAATVIDLPDLTLGNGQWQHHTTSWSPPLPGWLTFDGSDPSALELRGTPPATHSPQVYTLSVDDYDSYKDTGTFKVCISAAEDVSSPSQCGLKLPALRLTRDRRSSVTLHAAQFGTGAYTYRLFGRLDGLEFDAVTRRLSGTPRETGTFFATYTATDSAGAMAFQTYQITVSGPVSFTSAGSSGLEFTEGTAVDTTLPAARGGAGELSYRVTGLPAGLSFDPSSRRLSGIPEKAGTFELTLEATDRNGDSDVLSILLRVHPSPVEEGPPAEEDTYSATVAFGAAAYTVAEGGPAAAVVVRLDKAPVTTLSIPITGRGSQGVTAGDWQITADEAAGDSWDAATGTASALFAPGQTERTLALEAFDDSDAEGDETLTLEFDIEGLPDGVTVDPEASEAVVTLVDNDIKDHRGRALEHILAAFGRTVATDAVGLLTGRMKGEAPDTESRITLGGHTFELRGSPDPFLEQRGPPDVTGQVHAVPVQNLLSGASFRHSLGGNEHGSFLTLWGQGGTAHFEGRSSPDFSLDGETTSGWLGMDWRQRDAVAGLSLSHYRGDVDYDFGDNRKAGGGVDLELTSLFPYVRLSLEEGLALWGIAGLGSGRLKLTDGFGNNRTDLSMQMAAAGLRHAVKPVGERGFNLAVKADGFLVRVASKSRGLDSTPGDDDLPSVDAYARRLRLALEADYTRALASGAVLRPTTELGARYDGGDADTGAGLDLAGGLRYQSPSRRLTMEGRGRVLLTHAEGGFQDWAASGLVQLSPRAGGQGLSFSVEPSWGVKRTGPSVLWDAEVPDAAGEMHGRVNANIGYGLPAFRGRGLLTLYAGTELAQVSGRTWRIGVRGLLEAQPVLNLEGTRRESDHGEPESSVGLRLSFPF